MIIEDAREFVFDAFTPVYSGAYYNELLVHKEMLDDRIRVSAFQEAIEKTVKGKTVIDIGTGTGILAMMAARAGAKKVYAIESEDIIDCAKHIAKANHLDKNIFFIKSISYKADLPRADVLVSEMIGHYGIEESIVEVFRDARERLLRKNSIIIPNRLRLYLVPVSIPKFYHNHSIDAMKRNFENIRILGVDIMLDDILNEMRKFSYSTLLKGDFLAKPKMIKDINLYKEQHSDFDKVINFKILKNSSLTGLLGWFDATLADGISINTSPLNPPTSWKQAFFPLPEREVKSGEKIKVNFGYSKDDECRFYFSFI